MPEVKRVAEPGFVARSATPSASDADGARALGRFDDTEEERAAAATMAAEAATSLARARAGVHTWARSFSG